MSENKYQMNSASDSAPGYICPFCATDCSPIAGAKCLHLFLIDGENGWRFTSDSRSLFDSATAKSTTLFRDLLYHNPECRSLLKLQRASYDDSLEIYVFSEDPNTTIAAFNNTIAAA